MASLLGICFLIIGDGSQDSRAWMAGDKLWHHIPVHTSDDGEISIDLRAGFRSQVPQTSHPPQERALWGGSQHRLAKPLWWLRSGVHLPIPSAPPNAGRTAHYPADSFSLLTTSAPLTAHRCLRIFAHTTLLRATNRVRRGWVSMADLP